MKIISGGQTGVDRGALDAALAQGVDAGGWCPQGRQAEDGEIPPRYPVMEWPGADYEQRTLGNVIDSDATLIVCFGAPRGGTAQTLAFCTRENKAFIVVDAETTSLARAVTMVTDFVSRSGVGVLNVAGPRASEAPAGHDYACELISGVLGRIAAC